MLTMFHTFRNHRLGGGKSVSIGMIHAYIEQKQNNSYDIELDVNSQKFLLEVETDGQTIESMNIYASKSYVEMKIELVKTVRKLMNIVMEEYQELLALP